eukprot:jgi/Mesen1/437/ME000101S10666
MALASGKVAAKLLFLLIAAGALHGALAKSSAEECKDVAVTCLTGHNCTGETPTLKMCTSRTAIDTDLLRRTAGTAKKKEAKRVEVQEVKSTLAAARSLTPRDSCYSYSVSVYLSSGRYLWFSRLRLLPNYYAAIYDVLDQNYYGEDVDIMSAIFYISRRSSDCYIYKAKASRSGSRFTLSGTYCCY